MYKFGGNLYRVIWMYFKLIKLMEMLIIVVIIMMIGLEVKFYCVEVIVEVV